MRDHTQKLEKIAGSDSRKKEEKSYSFKAIIREKLQAGGQRKTNVEADGEETAGLLSSHEREQMEDRRSSMQPRKDSYDAGRHAEPDREVQQHPHEMISAAHEQDIRRPIQDIEYPVREPMSQVEQQRQEREELIKPEREIIDKRYNEYNEALSQLNEKNNKELKGVEEKYPLENQWKARNAAKRKLINDFNHDSATLQRDRDADLKPIFERMRVKTRELKERHAEEASKLGFRSSDTPTA